MKKKRKQQLKCRIFCFVSGDVSDGKQSYTLYAFYKVYIYDLKTLKS